MPTCGTTHNAKIWMNWEPCGIVCAAVTWCIVLYSDYVLVAYILVPWFGASFYGIFHVLWFNAGCFLALSSHLKAMLTDPGAVPRDARPLQQAARMRQCRRCASFKPKRAHHCSICQRCVVKMDHHCPWVNNCVGLGNHKFFLLFIGYVCALCAYAMVMIIARYFSCIGGPMGCMTGGSAVGSLLVVGVVICSMLFGLFTFCMMCDQATTVITNQTGIDRLQADAAGDSHEEHQRPGLVANLKEVFGTPMGIHWALPTDVKFPNHEVVWGYVTDAERQQLV